MKQLITCALSVLFFLEGMMFYNHYSYAHHIDEAKDSIQKLEQILEDGSSSNPLGASLLGIFEARDNFVDIQYKHLTQKIINSTEMAIENADDITEVSKIKIAIDEISEVQKKEVSIIHKTLQKIEADDISQEVEADYSKAVVLKQKVVKATAQIQEAISNNQETIEINIVTDLDEPHSPEQHEEDKSSEESTNPSHSNPNLERIRHQKMEDAAQREVNRKRIRLIEEGREAQKAQKHRNIH